jgi:D-alanyl-D-alanine carboxypeptidase
MGPSDVATHYADTNFLIAGRLIEAVSGEDYYAYLQRAVLDPLRLAATSASSVRDLPGLVPGYLRETLAPYWGPKSVGEDGRLVYNPSWEFTGGGLVSTPVDLARFVKALAEGQVLSAPRLAEMKAGWPMEYPLANHRYGPSACKPSTPTWARPSAIPASSPATVRSPTISSAAASPWRCRSTPTSRG